MTKVTKIILAALLLLCLLDLPYSYYLFVRWSAMIGFSYLAYISYKYKQNFMTIVFVLLAVLFQPFDKIALGRTLWNVVDVIIGLTLIILVFFPGNKSNYDR